MEAEIQSPPLYREEQTFSQLWLKFLLIVPTIFVWFIFFQQIILGKPMGRKPAPDAVVIILTILLGIVLPLLLGRMRLILEVRPEGFYYRFIPFQRRWRRLLWSDISHYEKINFSAIKDFGGYGIRSHKGETVYVIQGNRGLRFYLHNGRRIVFSSGRADELFELLNSFYRP